MPEILRIIGQGIKDHPRRAIGLTIAGAMLTGAGYLCLNGQLPNNAAPDLNSQNPVPTQPIVIPTEAMANSSATQKVTDVPDPSSTQVVLNGEGYLPGVNCVVLARYPAGDLVIKVGWITPIYGYRCLRVDEKGYNHWELNGRKSTTNPAIDGRPR